VTAPLTVVIPAYREAARIGVTLEALVEEIDGTGAEIIVVDDGSDDETASTAEKVLSHVPGSRVLRFERNRGKGAAVRAGALAATGDVIVFMDADLATELDALEPLVRALDAADVAIGSRTAPGSATAGGTTRRMVMARCFNVMVRHLTEVPFLDTQCGFKAFRRDAARRIFGQAKSDRFAFDVELLAIARNLDMTVVEVPVRWTAIEQSRVRWVDPPQMTLDLLRIAIRCRTRSSARRLRDDEPPTGGAPAASVP
jgi:glycosyltransferase involved in cell wall biosynthesis